MNPQVSARLASIETRLDNLEGAPPQEPHLGMPPEEILLRYKAMCRMREIGAASQETLNSLEVAERTIPPHLRC